MPHFITVAIANWIDVFSREWYKKIMFDSINFCIAENRFVELQRMVKGISASVFSGD